MRQAVGQGATVVMSSHELERAEALADRVVVLDGGTTDGPGGDRSADPRVAGPPVTDRGAVPGAPGGGTAEAPDSPDAPVDVSTAQVSHVA